MGATESTLRATMAAHGNSASMAGSTNGRQTRMALLKIGAECLCGRNWIFGGGDAWYLAFLPQGPSSLPCGFAARVSRL